jgi:primosomal replication protein N
LGGAGVNQVQLSGELIGRGELRFTPAGLPVLDAQLRHVAEVIEAGRPRSLDFAIDAVALGGAAQRLAQESLGACLQLRGFLAPRARGGKRIRVHVVEISRIGE